MSISGIGISWGEVFFMVLLITGEHRLHLHPQVLLFSGRRCLPI